MEAKADKRKSFYLKMDRNFSTNTDNGNKYKNLSNMVNDIKVPSLLNPLEHGLTSKGPSDLYERISRLK